MVYSACVVPFDLAWETSTADLAGGLSALLSVDIAVEVMFLLDLVLHFRVPYHDRQTNEPVETREKIRRHYLRGWFAVDAMSALPVELSQVAWVSLGGTGARSGDALRVLSATRILKLLRLAKLARLRSMEALSREYPTQSRMAQIMFAFFFTIHIMACR